MSDKKNCALSFKKDNSGSCNTIVNGKLRVKKTARIEDTLAVENNLQVYNDVNIGGDINATSITVECVETKGLTADTIGATSITVECVETKGLTADTIGATSITVECVETKGLTADSINVENITVNNTVFFNSMTGNSINVDTIVANEITGYTFTAVVCVTSINVSVTGIIEASGIIVDTVDTKSLTADTISTTSIYADTACIDELEMDIINPKGATVGDNYIRMNADIGRRKWIRYRSTTDPYHSGVVFSEFDGHNYFMYANESKTSITGVSGTTSCENANLFISYYGTTISGNDPISELSTPIFSLCPNGDLKLAGIVEAKGLTADTIGATTINTVDLNVSGTAIFGGGSIKIDGDNHTISTTIDEDLKFETGGTSSEFVMNLDGNNLNLVIRTANANSDENGIAFKKNGNNYNARIYRSSGNQGNLVFSTGNTSDASGLTAAMTIESDGQKVITHADLEVTNDLKVLNDLTVTGELNVGSIGFTGISLTSITATDGCIDNLEIVALNPKNLSSGDNYIRMNADIGRRKWIRYRSTTDPSNSGVVFSQFDGHNYFMYANESKTSITGVSGTTSCENANLFISYYGTTVNGNPVFNSSTPIFSLCPNGDLKLAGIIEAKGLNVSGSLTASTIEAVDLNVSGSLTTDTINGFSTNDLQQNKLGSKFDKDKTGSEFTILKNGLGVLYSSTTKSRAMCLNSFTIPFGLEYSYEGFKRRFGFKIIFYDDTANLNIGFGISTLIKNGNSVYDTEIGSFSYRYDGELFENGSNTTMGLPSYATGDIIEFEISSTVLIPYKDYYNIYKNGVLIHTSFIDNDNDDLSGLYYPQVFDSSSDNSTFKIVLMPSYNTGYLETLKLTASTIEAVDLNVSGSLYSNFSKIESYLNSSSLPIQTTIINNEPTNLNLPESKIGKNKTSDFTLPSTNIGEIKYTGSQKKYFKISYNISVSRNNNTNAEYKTTIHINNEPLPEGTYYARHISGASLTYSGEIYKTLNQNDIIKIIIAAYTNTNNVDIYSYSLNIIEMPWNPN